MMQLHFVTAGRRGDQETDRGGGGRSGRSRKGRETAAAWAPEVSLLATASRSVLF